jgi:hypothetical protein
MTVNPTSPAGVRRAAAMPKVRTTEVLAGVLEGDTVGGLLSLGVGGASISGMTYSIPSPVGGSTGSFFIDGRTYVKTER